MAGQRLDILLTERGFAESRARAQAAIMSGVVYVDGQKSDKPGQSVRPDAAVEVRENPLGFVSRGGLKMQKALDLFGLDVRGLDCIDVGASTGGFTDCLLQRGARHVWAVDVGYGQLAWSLRNDPRVTVMERQNIRYVTSLPDADQGCAPGGGAGDSAGEQAVEGFSIRREGKDFAAVDVSFISLRLVLPALLALLSPEAQVVALVKPQFEAGRALVGKSGVIRDGDTHLAVLEAFVRDAKNAGFSLQNMTFSPIKGPKGNREFLAWLTQRDGQTVDLAEVVARAHKELPE